MAHRGGAHEAAENTRSAFDHAVSLGYTYLETDIQVTRDGIAVLFHDDDLGRVTDASGPISSLTWNQLRRVESAAGVDQLLRLDDALDLYRDQRFNLDLKSDAAVEPFLAVLNATAAYRRVLVGSFSDARLSTVRRRVGPQLATSAGPREVAAAVASARRLPRPRPTTIPVALQVPVALRGVTIVNRQLVEQAHARGVEVHVWTIDDADEMMRLLDLGVDGILTDRPTLLREVLHNRGQWNPDE